MSIARKIASNTLWQIVGKIIGTLASGFSLILLTRYLSQEQFGYYGTALSLTQFAAVLCDLGLYVVCLKEISIQPNEEEEIFNNFLSLRIVSATLILGTSLIIIFTLPYPLIVKQASLIFTFGFLFSSIVQLLTTFFQKRMFMNKVAIAETLGKILMLLVIAILLKTKINLPWVATGSVIASGVSVFWLYLIIKKYYQINLSINFSSWKNILKKTWPVTLGVLLNLVYFRADSIILSLTKPATDVAIYTAPYKLLEIIATFPHMFMGLILPLSAAAWSEKNLTSLNYLTQKTSEFFLMVTMPLLALSLTAGDKIMVLVAGSQYYSSGTIMFPLMLATTAIFAGTAFTYLAVTIDKQKAMLPFYGLAAFIAIILYTWLIPLYSYVAAAWITALVEIFIAFSAYVITKKSTGFKILNSTTIKIIISGVCITVFLYSFNQLNIIVQTILAFIIYLALLFITKAISWSEIKHIIELKNKN